MAIQSLFVSYLTAMSNLEIVPLSAFAKHATALKIAALEAADEKDSATAEALVACINLLKALKATENWGAEKALVSLIKQTKDCGNTSVSMGLAGEFLKPIPNVVGDFKTFVTFLNCGTGGIKYQTYIGGANGVTTIYHEYKPTNGANPQGVADLFEVIPITTGDVVNPEGCRILVGKGMRPAQEIFFAEFSQARAMLGTKLKEDKYSEADIGRILSRPCYAFVTGTIREEFEKASQERRDGLTGAMREYMGFGNLFFGTGTKPNIFPAVGSSYFLSQDDEGKFELAATRYMHYNLAAGGKVVPPGAEVVISMGVGRGSFQFVSVCSDDDLDVIGTKFGMNSPTNLAAIPAKVLKKFVPEDVSRVGIPIIALKSGFLLLLDSNPALRKKFLSILQQ